MPSVLSRHFYCFIKRAFDILDSDIVIALLTIYGAVLSAFICAKSPGLGPLYLNVRVGRLCEDRSIRLFLMWKFRSMVPHSDEMLDEFKERNVADGPLFKIKDDSRVIPDVRHFIRKRSIDKQPQLLNVFVDKISLMGSRLGLPSEIMQCEGRAIRRLSVKLGRGGTWRAGERLDSTFELMVDADLDSIRECSFRCDLAHVFGSLRSMLDGREAY